jgi:dihydroneopterin aldolase
MAVCGVLPEEQARQQPFEVDADIFVDMARAGASDDLAHTVDYGMLCASIDHLASTERYALLERFAARIAETVLAAPLVTATTVVVRKLRPPVPQQLITSGVRIHRSKSQK